MFSISGNISKRTNNRNIRWAISFALWGPTPNAQLYVFASIGTAQNHTAAKEKCTFSLHKLRQGAVPLIITPAMVSFIC